ncbi:unnamed protein product [Symbiodinium pilosum]|uniref:Uncharacterized protein n=1 Tax=Symbiodinium pilosum TaxID=2952 RepID=A0A812JJN5_SYMPI|nr:unnamed protein product [Symbiodinium pilosum]
MSERSGVSFECPDVRASPGYSDYTSEHLAGEADLRQGDNIRFWLCLKPGLAYVGTCQSMHCPSQKTEYNGLTVCNVGMGTHRPNEHMCDGAILCPACKAPFKPEEFFFQYCSAKVKFCIEHQENDEFSFSENRKNKGRVFGKRGKVVRYTMLRMEVRKPGMFSETLVSRMDPRTIRYSQESISPKFAGGKDVRTTSKELREGAISVSDVPPIHVFRWNGKWHSSDNRRLWTFKDAGVESVPVIYIDKEQVQHSKLTTKDHGQSIKFRYP